MAVVYNLKGTSQSDFQIGKGGPKLAKVDLNLEIQTPGGQVVVNGISSQSLNIDGFNFPSPRNSSSGQILKYNGTTVEWSLLSKDVFGLDQIDNTSDQDKPLSSATQAALFEKQDVLVSGVSIKTINGQSLLGSGDIELAAEQALSDMDDVDLTMPASGDFLYYNGSEWVNEKYVPGVTSLNDLDDVNVTTIGNGYILSYNSSSQQWQTMPPSGNLLSGLDDVTIAAPSHADLLFYDGDLQDWVNIPLEYEFIENAPDLTVYLNRDGSSVMTGDLDMGENIITNVAVGTEAGHAVEFSQFETAIETLNLDIDLKASASDLAGVAFSGDYNDLINSPPNVGELSGLDDVELSLLSDFDCLVYNSTDERWVNFPFISQAAFFDTISDVGTGELQEITLPDSNYTSGNVIVIVNGLTLSTGEYSITGDKLSLTTNNIGDMIEVRSAIIGINNGVTSFSGLNDTTILAPNESDIIQFKNNKWVNTPAKFNKVQISAPSSSSHILTPSDSYVRLTNNNSVSVKVPTHDAAAIPVGTRITIVRAGDGTVNIDPLSGVTVNKLSTKSFSLSGKYASVALTKVDENVWDLSGDLVSS